MMKSCGLHNLAFILVIVGALNWGLVGLGMLMGANWNLVYMIVGKWPTLEAIVYLLVGLSAVASLFKGKCKMCTGGSVM